MALAKARGVKVLLRDEATLKSAPRSFWKRAAKRVFFSMLNRLCDGFLAIGTLNARYYQSYGIAAGKIYLVPYAVDNAFFQQRAAASSAALKELRSSLGLAEGRPVILFASKFLARKRTADLLEAYIQMSPDGVTEPHPYLLLVGEGEERPALEARARETGWNSVKFPGFKNQSELPGYYSLCQVFVLPSVYEPWGLVVNELMNAGRAVIVSDQAGCGPDLVKNGENGYIFPAGDAGALRQVLCKVLENQETCRAMGRKSLEMINKWGFEEDVAGLKKAINYVMKLELS
jgi:glycosyltransferase involved in cell wall biosynthesis